MIVPTFTWWDLWCDTGDIGNIVTTPQTDCLPLSWSIAADFAFVNLNHFHFRRIWQQHLNVSYIYCFFHLCLDIVKSCTHFVFERMVRIQNHFKKLSWVGQFFGSFFILKNICRFIKKDPWSWYSTWSCKASYWSFFTDNPKFPFIMWTTFWRTKFARFVLEVPVELSCIIWIPSIYRSSFQYHLHTWLFRCRVSDLL